MKSKAKVKGRTVPKLRFPEFRTHNWELLPIGDMLSEVQRPLNMQDNKNYSLVTVKRNYGSIISRGVLRGDAIKVKSQFLVHTDDFLISNRQIVHNACGLVPKELDGSIVSNEYSVLEPKKNCDIKFLNCFVQQPKVSESFLKSSRGIVIEKMLFNLNDWLKRQFLFPIIAEQKKIATCLTAIDELISIETKKLDILIEHKKGLMQNLFPAEGAATPKCRFPEFRKDRKWEVKQLNQIAEVVTGNTPSTTNAHFYNGNRPFVTPGDITGYRYVSTTKITLSEEGFNETRPIKANSILFVCIGSTIGKIAQNIFECATNQQINTVMPFSDYVIDFVYTILELKSRKIAAIAGKHAVPIINKTEFSNTRIFVPSVTEQIKIAACFSSLDNLITAQSQKIGSLKMHKKGLMQQLFPVVIEENA